MSKITRKKFILRLLISLLFCQLRKQLDNLGIAVDQFTPHNCILELLTHYGWDA